MNDHANAPSRRELLEAWVLATLPRAVSFAASLLNDRTAANDVAHDCYCRILAKANVYDIPRDGTKILFRAITNACQDYNHRRRPLLGLDRVDEETAMKEELRDAKAVDPAHEAVRRELEDSLGAALARLPVAQRAAVELKSLGHTLQEIAEALKISPSNAGVLIHRARQTLAKDLEVWIGEASS